MVRLYIIRHGDPDYDTNKAEGGTLTANGEAEARALGKFLQEEGITHAYTSPLGRAKRTAEIALAHHPQFDVSSFIEQQDEVVRPATLAVGNQDRMPIRIEPWLRELSHWRVDRQFMFDNFDELDFEYSQRSHQSLTVTCMEQKKPHTYETQSHRNSNSARKTRSHRSVALWDYPAPFIRRQLSEVASKAIDTPHADTSTNSLSTWHSSCPQHAMYLQPYQEFCKHADDFLARHGIIPHVHSYPSSSSSSSTCKQWTNNYTMSFIDAQEPMKRSAKIALFCHGGTGLTLLAHLLSIPLPIVHASMWLPPSSVTIVLMEEHAHNAMFGHYSTPSVSSTSCRDHEDSSLDPQEPENHNMTSTLILSPRAICIGGTNHLTANGLSVSMSRYEDYQRPSGIKHNWE